MHKDFDSWNKNKKHTHEREDLLLYQEREIRWCRLGVNVGFEQDGTGGEFSRPVLILKGFNRHVCLVVPLTTATKENPYYMSLGTVGGRESYAIISQLRLIDTKRLDTKVAVLDNKIFERIRKAIKDML